MASDQSVLNIYIPDYKEIKFPDPLSLAILCKTDFLEDQNEPKYRQVAVNIN